MKPVYLSVQAFGPFAACQTVDFSRFENRTLFLIHGNTGSGKTTILDAICFALYGELSGRDRDASRMRSDFSNDSFQTEVTFTFSLGKEYYKITRIPEQLRSKKRGSGTTTNIASATLWKIDNANNNEETVLADKWSRVTEKVEQLLGFRSDQFRQVVILPQGDFRRLLSANSSERQEILATLFKTERFKRFEDELRDASKKLKNQYDQLSFERNLLFKDTSVSTTDEISSLIDSIKVEISLLAEEQTSLRNSEKSILDKISEIKSVNSKFVELDKARFDYNLLFSQKNEFDAVSVELDFIEKSVIHKNAFEQLLDTDKEISQLKTQIETAQALFLKTKIDFTAASEALNTAQNMQSEKVKIAEELSVLRRIEPKLSELVKSQSAFSSVQKKVADLLLLQENKKIHLEKVRVALDKLVNSITIARENSILSDTHRKNYSETAIFLKSIDRLIELRKTQSAFQTRLVSCKYEYDAVIRDIETNKNLTDKLAALKDQYQAASFALTLSDNTPCPVCGSKEHPSPAKSPEELPDEKELALLKENHEKLEAKRELRRNDIEDIQIKLSSINNEISMIDKSLENCPSKDRSELCAILADHEKKFNESKDAAARLEKLSNDKSRGDTALSAAEKDLDNISTDLTSALSEQSSLEATIRALESDIPEKYRTLQNLTSAVSMKELRIKEFDDLMENTKRRFDLLNNNLISITANLESLKARHTSLVSKRASQNETLLKKVAEDGFSDMDHLNSCIEKTASIDSIKKHLNNYQLSFHSSAERLKRIENECSSLKFTDITEYNEQLRQIQEKSDSVSVKLAGLTQKHELLSDKLSSINSINIKIDSIEKQYAIAGRLSETASGSNQYRMTFERFILSSLLDEVLYAGTHRLKIMSRGRFELHRALTAGDMRTSGGLDLQVFDSYTGTERPVSSLSGGESFLAALSLALGLADVVQSRSGGIKLETIFIDEGFGSLDSEALDLAFSALADLGQGGRLVGIISHVSELRERIDSRLEVTAARKGSSISIRR